MKVLLISTVAIRRNGITAVIFNQVKVLKRCGIVFDLVASNQPESNYIAAIEETGGSVFVVPRSTRQIVKYFFALKKLIRGNNYDIVHIHGNSGTCTIEAIAAKMAKAPGVVVHSHSSACRHNILHKILRPVLNRLVDERLACSDVAGKFMFGKRPFHVMNNAIELGRYRYNEAWRQEIRGQYAIAPTAPIIGHVATFNDEKNHSFLLRVFHSYRQIHENAVLMLIGQGKNESEIRNQVKTLGLEACVIFVGGVDNVNVYMSAFDCFILPSLFEGLPLVLLEAQASGMRCLASTAVSTDSNITGNVAFFGLDQTPEQWSKALATCICEWDRAAESNAAIQKLSDRGYDLERESATLMRYYSAICQKHR